MNYLGIRGDSYSQHHRELLKGLFEPHDSFMEQNLGFNTFDIISLLDEIKIQIEKKIQSSINIQSYKSELFILLKEFLNYKGLTIESKFDPKLAKEFQSTPQVMNLLKMNEDIINDIKHNVFKIELNSRINKKLLERLCCTFGENNDFLKESSNPLGWPTNPSIIYSKPILKFKGAFYGYGMTVLTRNAINIIQDLIKTIKPKYYTKSYKKACSKYLENKSLQYLGKILKNAEIYPQAHYRIIENGLEKDCETDGLVVFDSNLFILEAKAFTYTLPAKKGFLPRIKKTVKENIDSAYSQALRTETLL